MMDGGYIFDKDNVKFRKLRTPVRKRIRRVMLLFIASLSLTVVYYVVFALFFSTETESRLERENEVLAGELPAMYEREEVLADVIEGLRRKDDVIYEDIFKTSAPSLNSSTSILDVSRLDSLPDSDLLRYAERKLHALAGQADAIEENFARITELMMDSSFVVPPMHNPLEDFTYAQTGASVGHKIDPFYKVPDPHYGLDLIAHSGEPVYAAADGIVTDVIMSRKGLGNVVVISHAGGYLTRYAHLADIEVRKGRKVERGTRIGYVGVSGNSFAPHLHYEVQKDTVIMDPVNHLFASVSVEEYVNLMIMAATTGQSLD